MLEGSCRVRGSWGLLQGEGHWQQKFWEICHVHLMANFVQDKKDKHHMQTTLMCIFALIDLGLQENQFQKVYNPRALSFITREIAEWNYLDGSKTLSHSCPIGLQPRWATPDTQQTQMLTVLPLPLLTKVTCFLTAIYCRLDLPVFLFCYNLSNHVSFFIQAVWWPQKSLGCEQSLESWKGWRGDKVSLLLSYLSARITTGAPF